MAYGIIVILAHSYSLFSLHFLFDNIDCWGLGDQAQSPSQAHMLMGHLSHSLSSTPTQQIRHPNFDRDFFFGGLGGRLDFKS